MLHVTEDCPIHRRVHELTFLSIKNPFIVSRAQVLEVSVVYEIYDELDSPELEYPPAPPGKPSLSSVSQQSGSLGSYSSNTSEGNSRVSVPTRTVPIETVNRAAGNLYRIHSNECSCPMKRTPPLF